MDSDLVWNISQFKGLNRSSSRFNMDHMFAWDILNGYADVAPDGRGAIQQRQGTTKINGNQLDSGDSKCRYLTSVLWANGTEELVARIYDGWYRISSGNYTSLDASRTEDARGMSTMFDDNLIMVDGGTPRKSNSSHTVSDLSADANMPTNSTAVWTHRNRVWLNEPGTMKIYGSKVSDATGASAWSTADDSIELDLSYVLPETDEFIGFGTVASTLLVIVGKKFIVIYDAPETASTMSLYKIVKCNPLSQQGIVPLAGDYAICLDNGFNMLSSTETYERLKLDDLSSFIENLWIDQVGLETDKLDVCSILDHSTNQIYITFHNSQESNTLVYSLAINNFVGRFQFYSAPYSWCEDTSGIIYFGAANGDIYKIDDTVYTDDSNSFQFQWELPYLGIDNQMLYKAPREVEMMVETNTSVTMYLDYFFGENDDEARQTSFSVSAEYSRYRESLYRSAYFRGSGRALVLNLDYVDRGKTVGVSIYHTTSGARVRIPYVLIKYILEGEK